MENRNEIWVFAQLSHGLPMPVVSELIAKAQEISAEIEGSSVAAVVFGDDNEKALQELGALKIDKIYNLENPELASYRCDVYAAAMCNLVETYQPAYLFFGATAVGSELAPSVAALVKTGLAAHCIDLKWNGERLNCIVPAFGGKVVSEIYIPKARPVMASVRPGILGGKAQKGEGQAEVISADDAFLAGISSGEEFLGFVPDEHAQASVEDADIVIAAGRGVSTDQTWEQVKELAARTGGSVAWSRSFIDTGRVPDERSMVGTSGKALRA